MEQTNEQSELRSKMREVRFVALNEVTLRLMKTNTAHLTLSD